MLQGSTECGVVPWKPITVREGFQSIMFAKQTRWRNGIPWRGFRKCKGLEVIEAQQNF